MTSLIGWIAIITALSYGTTAGIVMPNYTYVNEEERLISHLLDKYDKRIRPVNVTSKMIIVAVGLAITDVVDLHEKDEVFETGALLREMWEDMRFRWEPSKYGGIATIHIPSASVWKPDVVLLNNADTDVETFDPLVVVFHTGTVIYIPKVRLRAKCPMDMTKFPMDRQTCRIQFGSWTYDVTHVNITHFTSEENGLDIRDAKPSKEWRIVTTTTKRIDHKNDFGNEIYPLMEYSFILQRNSVYYTQVFILPAVLLAVLVPFTFLLPPESRERITLGSVLLLCILVLLMMLQQFLPESHPNIPTIASYYIVTIIWITLSLLTSIFIINIQSRGPRKKKVPSYLRQLFLRGLKRVVCLGDDTYYPLDELETVSMRGLDRTMDGIVRQENTTQSKMERDVEEILRHLHTLTIRSTVLEARHEIRNEWHQVALVLDRIFFFLFILTFLLYTFVLLA
ncbi:neuronal acetylcholine receptor subunit alpha-5-like [Ylistrum balloti]|uniref:neuronal acetylcholine receptor subunit alpha-5-like n=1 Tax=Ylistrum balloti TaxID=509963 RepID=UPI002905AC7E|nr:neuronal acetylcholine receptor subunit alpha-5-like [Ylistrum balloti]